MIAAPVAAQDGSLDPRVGIAVPVGALGDFADAGPTAALGAALRVHPRFSLRVDVAIDELDGTTVPSESTGGSADIELPGIRIWRYTGGAEADVIVPGLTPLTVVADVGLGGASLSQPDADGTGPEAAIVGSGSATYFSAQGGVRVGWDFSRRLNAFAAAHAAAMFTGEPRSSVADGAGVLRGNGTLWAVPIVAGLRIRFY